MQPSIYQLVNP